MKDAIESAKTNGGTSEESSGSTEVADLQRQLKRAIQDMQVTPTTPPLITTICTLSVGQAGLQGPEMSLSLEVHHHQEKSVSAIIVRMKNNSDWHREAFYLHKSLNARD